MHFLGKLVLIAVVLAVVVRCSGPAYSSEQVISRGTKRVQYSESEDSDDSDSHLHRNQNNPLMTRSQIRLVENRGQLKSASKIAKKNNLKPVLRMTLYKNPDTDLTKLSPMETHGIQGLIKDAVQWTEPDSINNVYTDLPQEYLEDYNAIQKQNKRHEEEEIVTRRRIVRPQSRAVSSRYAESSLSGGSSSNSTSGAGPVGSLSGSLGSNSLKDESLSGSS
jgi:hypothetical protein